MTADGPEPRRSLGPKNRTAATAVRLADLDPSQRKLAMVRSVVIVVASCVLIVGAFYVLPIGRESGARALLRAGADIALVGAVFVWQFRRIHLAELPELRAVEALGIVITIFLVGFSAIYLAMSHEAGRGTSPNPSTTPRRSTSRSPSSPRSASATSRRGRTPPASSSRHRCSSTSPSSVSSSACSSTPPGAGSAPRLRRRVPSRGNSPRARRLRRFSRYGAGGTQPPRDGYVVGGCAPAARSRRLRRCTIRPAKQIRARPPMAIGIPSGRAGSGSTVLGIGSP